MLIGFTVMIFAAIDVDAEVLAFTWLLPCGAMGAIIIGSWLVESKQSVIENMAPVLTFVFTPLFALLLLAFLGAMAWTGNPIDVERDILIAFDLLLVLVTGLLLYAVSARDSERPPGVFDRLQVLLVVSALLVDALALAAIAVRISEFGFTPNRVAALGENVILLTPLYVKTRVLSGLGDGLACAEVCHDALVDLSRKEAFQASDDLAFGPAIGGASGDVVAGWLVESHADDDGSIEGGVGVSVTAPIEPMPAGGSPGRGRDRTGATQLRERGFGANPVRVIAEDDQQLGRGVGAHTEALTEGR